MTISSKNTPAEQHDVESITSSPDTAQAKQIAKLEDDLQSEKDRRRLEEFCFTLGFLVLFDVIAYRDLNWFADLLITVIEVVLILALGRFFGVEDIEVMVDRAFAYVGRFRGLPSGAPATPTNTANTPSTSDLPDDAGLLEPPSDTVDRD